MPQTAAFPMNWVYRREWRKVADLEARIARECDWSVFVSDAEAALFRKLQPQFRDKIRAVSNGVDLDYFDPARPFDAPYSTDSANFVFTGTMDYPPNVDAVVWFAQEILPVIRRSIPGAQFHIVGASPAPQVKALEAIAGVFVSGRVPDVRPYVAHATACVAPMRIARGIQNKVLEAMAMGRPTVVTADALEGIKAVPGTDLLLANGVDDFAKACLACAEPDAAALGAECPPARGERLRLVHSSLKISTPFLTNGETPRCYEGALWGRFSWYVGPGSPGEESPVVHADPLPPQDSLARRPVGSSGRTDGRTPATGP